MAHIPGRNDSDLHDENGDHRVPLVHEEYSPLLKQWVVPGNKVEAAERRYLNHLAEHAKRGDDV